MRNRGRGLAAALTLSASAVWCAAAAAPAYIRYPDINGNRIVFAAEGDLWVASDAGGVARRLTTHPGTEYFPRFSPDGKWIAFTGEYDGNQDVYVIPAEGGEPRRLTWHPGADQVVGWIPDGTKVLFRSRAENPQAWELFAVGLDGSDPEKLPLGWAARIDIDPDSGIWAFNRVTSEGRTWKRYRGGMASDIWVGRPELADFRKVGDLGSPQEFPMWHGGRIYFSCDDGGTINIWSMKPDGSDRRRHTEFKEWDARWPAMSRDGRIAFTLGGDIEVFNSSDNSVHKVNVELPSDRTLTRVLGLRCGCHPHRCAQPFSRFVDAQLRLAVPVPPLSFHVCRRIDLGPLHFHAPPEERLDLGQRVQLGVVGDAGTLRRPMEPQGLVAPCTLVFVQILDAAVKVFEELSEPSRGGFHRAQLVPQVIAHVQFVLHQGFLQRFCCRLPKFPPQRSRYLLRFFFPFKVAMQSLAIFIDHNDSPLSPIGVRSVDSSASFFLSRHLPLSFPRRDRMPEAFRIPRSSRRRITLSATASANRSSPTGSPSISR